MINQWRLGIKLGNNTLGWAALTLDNNNEQLLDLKACGVRVFTDGRESSTNQPKAYTRRLVNSKRKNRKRFLRRRKKLMHQLIVAGLMPKDKAAQKALVNSKKDMLETDPWVLRYRALHNEISLHQIGRALHHLHLRRGFKSNRLIDRNDENKNSIINKAIKKTEEILQENNALTLGEYYGKKRYTRFLDNQQLPRGCREPQHQARIRQTVDGVQLSYNYYPTRELILKEFDLIWEKQKQFHGEQNLQEKDRVAIRNIFEYQRPLQSKKDFIGKCTYFPDELRAPNALPSIQRSRIYQEVNHLRIKKTEGKYRKLTVEEREKILYALFIPTNKTGKKSFKALLKMIGFSDDEYTINIESKNRKELIGDATAAALMQEDRWGDAWFDLDDSKQDEIVRQLINQADEEKLITYLREHYNLSTEKAIRVANCPLPKGYSNLSEKATNMIYPFLVAGDIYRRALYKAGLHDAYPTEELKKHTRLPYYGKVLTKTTYSAPENASNPEEKQFGKIRNITIHRALNETRKVVNDLISQLGCTPRQIVIETAKELSFSAKDLRQSRYRKKTALADYAKIVKDLKAAGQKNTYQNRTRMMLFDELVTKGPGKCVYTGEPISADMVFSPEVEIEHILPYSRTFDNSLSNKVLCLRKANVYKENRTPWEAFGHSPPGYNWQQICERAEAFPEYKRRRFSSEAMVYYEKYGRGFGSQLNNNKFTTRIVKQYLSVLLEKTLPEEKDNIWDVSGYLTANLQKIWGLDNILENKYDDYRFHALDAIITGCISPVMLGKAAITISENETSKNDQLWDGVEKPWPKIRENICTKMENLIVSYKPEHGFQGKMHDETRYGISGNKEKTPGKSEKTEVYKSLKEITTLTHLKKIKCEILKSYFIEQVGNLTGNEFKQALLDAANKIRPRPRRIKIEEKLKVITFKNAKGEVHAAHRRGNNYCYDIWSEGPEQWGSELISTFEAYQRARYDANWWKKYVNKNGRKLLMRLRVNDCLELIHDGKKDIFRIQKITQGCINLVRHYEANTDARHRDKTNKFSLITKTINTLRKAQAQKVFISPAGTMKKQGKQNEN